MTTPAYAVSVAAVLEDKVTPGLLKIIDVAGQANLIVRELSANLLSMTGAGNAISRSLGRAAKAATALGDSSGGLTRASYVLDTMEASSAGVARNLAAANAAGRNIGTPAPGGGNRGGGGGGPSYAQQQSGKVAKDAAIVGGGLVIGGTLGNADFNDILARAMLTQGVASADQPAKLEMYRGVAFDWARKYGGVTHGEIEPFAEALLAGQRLLGTRPEAERMQVMQMAAPYAAGEAYLKKVPFDEAMSSFIELAHMATAYTPDKMARLFPGMLQTSLMTNLGLPQVTRAASYVIPSLNAVGVDPQQALLAIGTMQQAGILNSKSGTWLNNMVLNSIPKMLGSGLFKNTNQVNALTQLGMLKGKDLQFLNSKGEVDLLQIMDLLGKARKNMTGIQYAMATQLAFGKEGGRAAGLFGEEAVQENLRAVLAKVGKENIETTLAAATRQNTATAGYQTLANAKLFIVEATAIFQGPMTASFDWLSEKMKAATPFAKEHPILATGAVAVGAAALWASAKLAFKSLFSGVEKLIVSSVTNLPAIARAIGGFLLRGLSIAVGVIGLPEIATALGLAAAGTYVSRAVNRNISIGASDTIGGTIAKGLAFFGNDEAKGAVARRARADGLGYSDMKEQPMHVHTKVQIDGRTVANVVSEYIARSSGNASAGMSGFDPSMAAYPFAAAH